MPLSPKAIGPLGSGRLSLGRFGNKTRGRLGRRRNGAIKRSWANATGTDWSVAEGAEGRVGGEDAGPFCAFRDVAGNDAKFGYRASY